MTNAVVNKEFDAMVSEYPVALSIVASNPVLKIISFEEGNGFATSFEDTTVSVAVALESVELLESINTVLANISEETRAEWMKDAIQRQPEGE